MAAHQKIALRLEFDVVIVDDPGREVDPRWIADEMSDEIRATYGVRRGFYAEMVTYGLNQILGANIERLAKSDGDIAAYVREDSMRVTLAESPAVEPVA